jgi:hypothetical protein
LGLRTYQQTNTEAYTNKVMNVKTNNQQFHSSKPTSALHRIYARQQPKLKVTKNTSNLLKVFADDDHQVIATLLAVWLTEGKKSASS